jgi:hypothetical protein
MSVLLARQFHLLVAERATHHHCIHARTSHHAGEGVAEVVPASNFHSDRCRMEETAADVRN